MLEAQQPTLGFLGVIRVLMKKENFWLFLALAFAVSVLSLLLVSIFYGRPLWSIELSGIKNVTDMADILSLLFGVPVSAAGAIVAIYLARKALQLSENQINSEKAERITNSSEKIRETYWDIAKAYSELSIRFIEIDDLLSEYQAFLFLKKKGEHIYNNSRASMGGAFPLKYGNMRFDDLSELQSFCSGKRFEVYQKEFEDIFKDIRHHYIALLLETQKLYKYVVTRRIINELGVSGYFHQINEELHRVSKEEVLGVGGKLFDVLIGKGVRRITPTVSDIDDEVRQLFIGCLCIGGNAIFEAGNVKAMNAAPTEIIKGIFSIFPNSDVIFKVFMEMESVSNKDKFNSYAKNVIIESDTSEFLKYQPLGDARLVENLTGLDYEINCILNP